MKHYLWKIVLCVSLLFFVGAGAMNAQETKTDSKKSIDIKSIILEHVADSYEWHITTWKKTHVTVPLPIIVKGETGGWQCFSSSHLEHGEKSYNGFYISQAGKYKGKIVEKTADGNEVRPLDISITKDVASILFSCVVLLIIILSVSNWHKKQAKTGVFKAPKGFIGLMEMFIMNIQEDVIIPCVGKNYQKFSPYLLTVFFFILMQNLMGIIPFFPFGANVTGNIAVTFTLAFITFVIINIFGTKEYWKEIFWPDVPVWLKAFPLMPAIEFVGMFIKPFALMIRLFGNMLAGHSIVLGLTCLIFATVALGPVANGAMTVVSVLLTIFILFIELLVAFIQAYVFTLLSSVFIGMAQVEPHHAAAHE